MKKKNTTKPRVFAVKVHSNLISRDKTPKFTVITADLDDAAVEKLLTQQGDVYFDVTELRIRRESRSVLQAIYVANAMGRHFATQSIHDRATCGAIRSAMPYMLEKIDQARELGTVEFWKPGPAFAACYDAIVRQTVVADHVQQMRNGELVYLPVIYVDGVLTNLAKVKAMKTKKAAWNVAQHHASTLRGKQWIHFG